jgi:hypothetical protein
MTIHITPEELEEEYVNSWKMGLINHVSIDYADNAIHANYRGKSIIIFRFDKYGWINDNRYNKYLTSIGMAGITILIVKQ